MKGTTLGESKSRRDAWFWDWENFACCLPRWSAQLNHSKIVLDFWIITYNSHRLVVCGIFIYRSESVCIFGYTPINGMCFIIPYYSYNSFYICIYIYIYILLFCIYQAFAYFIHIYLLIHWIVFSDQRRAGSNLIGRAFLILLSLFIKYFPFSFNPFTLN